MKTTSIILSSIAACCLSLACTASDFTWTGEGGNGNWSTLANWSADGAPAERLPGGGDSVILTTTASGANGNTVEVDVDATFAVLTFKGTQNYTLLTSTGKTISTSGNWNVGAETEQATLTIGLKCAIGGDLYVGCDANLPGVLNVIDGADITATRIQIGGNNWQASKRHGWVYQSGGSVTVADNGSEAFKLGFAGGGSTGYYELTGGTLAIPVLGSVMSSSTGTLLLNGGTLKATAAREKFCENFGGNHIHLQIGANGGTFDTNGCNINFNDYPIETGVPGGTDGGLVKTGAGVLTLGAGYYEFTGALTVEEGSVVDSAGNDLAAESKTVHERRVVAVGGVERSYALYVPENVAPKPALVFSLHGTYGTIYTFYKNINGVKTKVEQENAGDAGVYYEPGDRIPFSTETADEAGCIVVYPQGLKRNMLGGMNYGWLSDGENKEDVDFFKAIIEDVASLYPSIDKKRVYCCGFSNGGMMAYAAATLASDTFAAFASISGYQLNEFHLRATGSRPVPFMHIHGKADDFVHYALWPTIRDMMVARNGCASVPTVTTVEGRYTKSVYAAGEGGFPFVAYECDGMGHEASTSHTEDGDSSKTMWNFMSRYTLDDACDKTLKMRMDSTSAERGWSETAAGSGALLSYGANTGANNVYRSVQLEAGAYTLSLKSTGVANDRYIVKLVDAADATRVLLNRLAKIGFGANFSFAVDAYTQCKLEIAEENAADAITEIAIHTASTSAPSGVIDCETLEFVEIPQSGTHNKMAKEEGDGYTGYTASGDIQEAYKMKDVSVAGCEFVVVKFAEPVPESGWRLSFTGGVIELPQGATEYYYELPESIRASGVLPECTLFTWFGAHSQQIKVAGVYKAKATTIAEPLGLVEIPQTQTGNNPGVVKEEGEGYTGYTASGTLQEAYKMLNVDVAGCESVLVKFAEPVPESGWWVAYWGTQEFIDLPKGSTEYNYIFPESVRASGRLPECSLLSTAWGTAPSKQIKVAGVYKVPAQPEPTDIKDKGRLIRIADGDTFDATACMQTVWERRNIGVGMCDYVAIKFAEPAPAGWGLEVEGVNGYIRIPEGASGYRLDFDSATIASGVFPRLALVALGPTMPQTVKVEGVYKHSLYRGFGIFLR